MAFAPRPLPALLLALLPTLAAAAPCECSDVKDMIYRIKEATALIAEYKRQIQGMEAKEAATGEKLMYSSSLYAGKLQPRIQAVANTVRAAEPGAKPNSATATTSGSACTTHVSGGSPCLQEAIARHEAHHAVVCSQKKGTLVGDLLTGFDYRNDMRLVEVAQEEITAYYLEIAYLSGELAKLPEACKPQSWFLHFEVTITGKGEKKGDQFTTSTSRLRHVYSGDVELSDPRVTPRPMTPEMAQKLSKMGPMAIMATMSNQEMVKTWRPVAAPGSFLVPLRVEIDDEQKTREYEPGEGDSFEDTKTTHTWNGTPLDATSNGIVLERDEAKGTYNLSIPIRPQEKTKSITDKTVVVIDRSKYGYGDAPTHEEPAPDVKKVPAKKFGIPNVANLLASGLFRHGTDLPFAPKEDILTFDSGELPVEPKAHFITHLPVQPETLRVRVYYSLSRLPLK